MILFKGATSWPPQLLRVLSWNFCKMKETFEKHGCQVSVSKLEDQLIALYVMLNRRICIKKLRKLMEKGKKFGLDFCITKTGMTTILTNRLKNLFKVWQKGVQKGVHLYSTTAFIKKPFLPDNHRVSSWTSYNLSMLFILM